MKDIDPEFTNARDRLIDLRNAKQRERDAVEALRAATKQREGMERAFANALASTIGPDVEEEARAATMVALNAQKPAVSSAMGSN